MPRSVGVSGGEMREDMSQITFEILALSGEPALVFQQGELIYCNPPAQALLDSPAAGTAFSQLFSLPLPGSDAVLSSVPLGGRSCSLRLTHLDGQVLVFLSPQSEAPLTLSDPMLLLLRDIQMGISLSSDQIREEAEASGNDGIRNSARVLTRDQFRLNRLVSNAAVAANLLGRRQAFQPRLRVPAELCSATAEALRFLLPGFKLEEQLETQAAFPLDPSLFKLLLLNLIANSLDAGSSRIVLQLRREEDLLLLRLSDNGSGIAPEELPLVFDRFRHDTDLAQMRRGAGLGLTVCRGVAELHGGTLLLESTPGKGTTALASFRQSPIGTETLLLPEDPLPSIRELLTGLVEHLGPELFDSDLLD